MGKCANYTRTSARNVLKEHDRTAKEYKNYVDKNRTHLNWSYGAGDQDVKIVMSKILSRCKKIMDGQDMQGHTNVMSNWVYTYPQELCYPAGQIDTGRINKKTGKPIMHTYYLPKDPDHCKRWMDTVYAFLQDRYGSENVIAGYVHMDETTPHLDVCFVPEAISRKTGRPTVSSASCITRTELKDCQRSLEKHMTAEFGQRGMILNGRTKGNYTVAELKTRQQDMEELEEKKEDLKIAQKEFLRQKRDFRKEKEALEEQKRVFDEYKKNEMKRLRDSVKCTEELDKWSETGKRRNLDLDIDYSK